MLSIMYNRPLMAINTPRDWFCQNPSGLKLIYIEVIIVQTSKPIKGVFHHTHTQQAMIL